MDKLTRRTAKNRYLERTTEWLDDDAQDMRHYVQLLSAFLVSGREQEESMGIVGV